MKGIVRLIREIVAYVLYFTGVLQLILGVRLGGKAVVLMYHRVLDDDVTGNGFARSGIRVGRLIFARQMRYLKKHFQILTLDQLITHLDTGRPFPERAVLITFDDGWKDNFSSAFPILLEHQIAAIVFLTSDYVGSERMFWQESLSGLLHELRRQCIMDKDRAAEASLLGYDGCERLLSCQSADVGKCVDTLVSAQKQKPIDETNQIVEKLRSFLGPLRDHNTRDKFLAWDEIRTMGAQGVAFGSHGKTHALLTKIGVEIAVEEIRGSKAELERELDMPVVAFSYPNGDYDQRVISHVRESGYKVAFGTNAGYVTMDSDRYRLKRINIHEDMTSNIPMLLGRIAGLW